MGTAADVGDERLTNPGAYGGDRHVQRALRTRRAISEMEGHMESGAMASSIGAERVDALRDFDQPRTPAERSAEQHIDAKAIGLGASRHSDDRDGVPDPTSKAAHRVRGVAEPLDAKSADRLLRQDESTRMKFALRHPIVPSVSKQHAIAKRFRAEEGNEVEAARLRERLAAEDGVFNRQRMDAYMLDDETAFPKWVRELPVGVRDQVMYGGLGLTDDEEWQRQNLAKLPREEREAEWARLRAAKSYELGEERPLSTAELWNARVGRREHAELRRRRQQREQKMRALALREPDRWTAAPIGAIDYSERLAVVARHVEHNVKTQGHWPLSEEALATSIRRQEKEKAKASFLEEHGGSFTGVRDRISPALREALDAMKDAERPYKMLSRKKYAWRLNAMRHGDQDERGQNAMRLSRNQRLKFRTSNAVNAEQVEASRKVAARRKPNGTGDFRSESLWPNEYQRGAFAHEMSTETLVDPSRGRRL